MSESVFTGKTLLITGGTGSFGKTSTKNYLAGILAEKYNIELYSICTTLSETCNCDISHPRRTGQTEQQCSKSKYEYPFHNISFLFLIIAIHNKFYHKFLLWEYTIFYVFF